MKSFLAAFLGQLENAVMTFEIREIRRAFFVCLYAVRKEISDAFGNKYQNKSSSFSLTITKEKKTNPELSKG